MQFTSKRLIIRIIMATLSVIMLGLIGSKLLLNEYSFEKIIPQESYSVALHMNFSGNGDDIVVRTFIPETSDYQLITSEAVISDGLNFRRESTPLFERGDWSKSNTNKNYAVSVHYHAQIQALDFSIPKEIQIGSPAPDNLQVFLEPGEYVQANHPEIQKLALNLKGDKTELDTIIRSVFSYVYRLGSKPFKGTTDALTTLRLGEASCNGKSRLFVAITRALGIPSRLVGGLILNQGTKKTSHQWVELYINSHWVPFDALNNHYAHLPHNYLRLYTGDEVLFTYSKNIGFDYYFEIQKNEVTNTGLDTFINTQKSGLFNFVSKLGFSISILQFLLVIPFGVMLVVFFKNVVGFKTYGTFLPALMAMAIQDTGIGAGLLAFVLVLILTILIRIPFEKLGLLHTPKLAVMMLAVITSLIGISSLALFFEWDGFSTLSSTAVFPIAILTITSERIAITIDEDGIIESILVLLQTLLVTAACYLIMSSVALKALVLVFPELLLGVLVMNLWIGSWTGIRVLELFRFRSLIFSRNNNE